MASDFTPKKRWSRDQQANFYYSLLDAETTVDDVKARYPDVEVVRFMKMAVMRRFVAGAPFSDHSLRQYAASDALSMSAFEYAYRSKDIATAIGAEFDKDGLLLPRSSTPERIVAKLPRKKLNTLEYLVNEFRASRLNTRSSEFKKTSDVHRSFVGRLSGDSVTSQEPRPSKPPSLVEQGSPAPVPESGRSASAAGTGHTSTDEISPATAHGSRGPNHPDTKDTLDLTALDYKEAPLNLKLRYFELRRVSLSNLPISAVILMRSVLESTIKVHFESSPTPVSGELSKVFRQVVESYGQDKTLRATINAIQSGNVDKHGSIQWFNLIAHSADAAAGADEVRQAWKIVSPLLRRLLHPPSQPAQVAGS